MALQRNSNVEETKAAQRAVTLLQQQRMKVVTRNESQTAKGCQYTQNGDRNAGKGAMPEEDRANLCNWANSNEEIGCSIKLFG